MAQLFPVTLQGVSFSALEVSEDQAYRTNDSEIGPATYQLLSENVPTIFNVSWLFYAFDFQVFENWYNYTLVKGVRSFEIDLPVSAGVLTHECNFKGKYRVSYQGRLIVVSASLRAIAKQYNSETEYDDLLLLANLVSAKNKLPILDFLVSFANIKLPDTFDRIRYGTDYS